MRRAPPAPRRQILWCPKQTMLFRYSPPLSLPRPRPPRPPPPSPPLYSHSKGPNNSLHCTSHGLSHGR